MGRGAGADTASVALLYGPRSTDSDSVGSGDPTPAARAEYERLAAAVRAGQTGEAVAVLNRYRHRRPAAPLIEELVGDLAKQMLRERQDASDDPAARAELVALTPQATEMLAAELTDNGLGDPLPELSIDRLGWRSPNPGPIALEASKLLAGATHPVGVPRAKQAFAILQANRTYIGEAPALDRLLDDAIRAAEAAHDDNELKKTGSGLNFIPSIIDKLGFSPEKSEVVATIDRGQRGRLSHLHEPGSRQALCGSWLGQNHKPGQQGRLELATRHGGDRLCKHCALKIDQVPQAMAPAGFPFLSADDDRWIHARTTELVADHLKNSDRDLNFTILGRYLGRARHERAVENALPHLMACDSEERAKRSLGYLYRSVKQDILKDRPWPEFAEDHYRRAMRNQYVLAHGPGQVVVEDQTPVVKGTEIHATIRRDICVALGESNFDFEDEPEYE